MPANKVPQQFYHDFLVEEYPRMYSSADIASVFEVSWATAHRMLSGLVYQGKIHKQGSLYQGIVNEDE